MAAAPVELALEWGVSAHARRLFYLALAGVGLAVVTRRTELVAFAAPALVLLGAWRAPRPKSVRTTFRLSASRVYEGEQLAVDVAVEGQGNHVVEVLFHPSDGVQAVKGGVRGSPGPAALVFQVDQWGRRAPGVVELVMWDRYRMFESHSFSFLPRVVCYPRPAQHRHAPALGRLATRSGDHAARSAGEGVEFFGVRQYAAGDRQRSINWAATTRRGSLQVNTFAAERSQDIVLLVDAVSDVGRPGSTSLDSGLRGALGVARTYLDARDRVGAVLFGKRLLWLPPGMGKRQFFRLTEAMLEVVPGWSAEEDLTRVPRPALPPGASVIAFSPLLDTKFVEALRDLRQRSFSIVVVDVLNVEPGGGGAKLDRLAGRVWRLEHEALIFSLGELGIPVVAWDGEQPLALPVQRHTRVIAGSRR
jgi:uncharacterized protein (DUF58 family)